MVSVNEGINYALIVMFFMIGVPGNILILTFFTTRCKLSKISLQHLLISLLAVPDLFICFGITMMQYVELNSQRKPVNDENGEKWLLKGYLGNITCCYLKSFPIHVAPAISAWMLVGISAERYLKITRPFNEPVKKRVVILYVGMLWVAAYCMSLPLTLTAFYNPFTQYCVDKDHDLGVNIHHILTQSLLVECIIPSIIILYLNIKLKRFLLHDEQTKITLEKSSNISSPSSNNTNNHNVNCNNIENINNNNNNNNNNNSNTICNATSNATSNIYNHNNINVNNHNHNNISYNNRVIMKRRIQSIQTVKWLFILFLVTMLPGRIVHAVRIILDMNDISTSTDIYAKITMQVFQNYVYLNNAINIFVYCWKNLEFRRFLLRILSFDKFCRNQS